MIYIWYSIGLASVG